MPVLPPRHVPGIPGGPLSPTASHAPQPAPASATAPSLQADHLAIGWKQGREERILAGDIRFSVYPGHLVALIGPNGAGKSTLLRTIAGLLPPLAGSLDILGTPLHTLDAAERATMIACVFNERFDAGYFTVEEIVAFGRYPYTSARLRMSDEDRSQIRKALELTGMAGFGGRRYASLSDGEKQKVQLARAVAQQTPILLLDEPTAFLDAPSRIEIFHLAGQLAQAEQKSIILCTHEIDLALKHADELWIFDQTHRFSAGSPYVISRSGLIGKAFDTATVHFDALSGSFRARQ
ncbi:MAG: ABC transporter ATP-binding protein [Rectinemataceae bacterium]